MTTVRRIPMRQSERPAPHPLTEGDADRALHQAMAQRPSPPPGPNRGNLRQRRPPPLAAGRSARTMALPASTRRGRAALFRIVGKALGTSVGGGVTFVVEEPSLTRSFRLLLPPIPTVQCTRVLDIFIAFCFGFFPIGLRSWRRDITTSKTECSALIRQSGCCFKRLPALECRRSIPRPGAILGQIAGQHS